jgi:aminomuconate-semialdehyde/2-hydroxymuconate-6-semialdehyde dehydrogenase
MIHIKNYIGGELVAPASKQYLDNVEPATGDVYSKVPASNARDVDRAVAAAEAAFGDWSRTPMEERSRILLHLARQIECRLEEFARAESVDTGKPLSLARSMDIPRAIKNFRFFATAIVHFRSEAHPTDYAALNFTLRRPRGVVGLISPWNLTAHMLSETAIEAGLPAGVLNVIHGTGPGAGEPIVAHPHITTISFTGGTATGARIAANAAPMFKKLALELGGKNPNIVFADAAEHRVRRRRLRRGLAG